MEIIHLVSDIYKKEAVAKKGLPPDEPDYYYWDSYRIFEEYQKIEKGCSTQPEEVQRRVIGYVQRNALASQTPNEAVATN
jgi:hypothetical protein